MPAGVGSRLPCATFAVRAGCRLRATFICRCCCRTLIALQLPVPLVTRLRLVGITDSPVDCYCPTLPHVPVCYYALHSPFDGNFRWLDFPCLRPYPPPRSTPLQLLDVTFTVVFGWLRLVGRGCTTFGYMLVGDLHLYEHSRLFTPHPQPTHRCSVG